MKDYAEMKQVDLQLNSLKDGWFLGPRSKLLAYNRFLLYKQIVQPIWTYGASYGQCKQVLYRRNKVVRK